MIDRRKLLVRRYGLLPYAEALKLQERLVAQRQKRLISDTVLLVEHPPVITLGRNARREHLLFPIDALCAQGIDVFESGRGGDVTFHGPGQAVVYPILDLSPDRRDVHRYVRDLEEVMIRTCADFGVAAQRVAKHTGIWLGNAKLGAIGVRIARWVTSHGLALNVANDLAPFRLIVPCGIADKRVTSLAELLGATPSLDDVFERLVRHLAAIFERDVESPDDGDHCTGNPRTTNRD